MNPLKEALGQRRPLKQEPLFKGSLNGIFRRALLSFQKGIPLKGTREVPGRKAHPGWSGRVKASGAAPGVEFFSGGGGGGLRFFRFWGLRGCLGGMGGFGV